MSQAKMLVALDVLWQLADQCFCAEEEEDKEDEEEKEEGEQLRCEYSSACEAE